MTSPELETPKEPLVEQFQPRIAILDAGGQYIDQIKKMCERMGYPAELLPYDTTLEEIEAGGYEAIVGSGGGLSVYEEDAPRLDSAIKDSDIPQLHICYSMQELMHDPEAEEPTVSNRSYRHDGRKQTKLDTSHPIFDKINPDLSALFTHGDFVNEVPEGYDIIGSHIGQDGQQVISAAAKGKTVCLQFHPEMAEQTDQGYEIIANFLNGVAELEPSPDFLENHMENYVAEQHEKIRERVGDKQVLSLISGGVDSVVASALVMDAIPKEQLHLVYVDNGYMRDSDAENIQSLIDQGWDIQVIDAASEFDSIIMDYKGEAIGPLSEASNPEHKRVLSGTAFMEVVDRYLVELEIEIDDFVLVQGTNAADRIESGHSKSNSGKTTEIKLHHNMVEAAREKDPLEPLDDLYKDEVRALGVHLGIPEEIAFRHPFPGPGNLIRILDMDPANVEPLSPEIEAEVEAFMKEVNEYLDDPLNHTILPARSVGVTGDGRSYIRPLAIEATEGEKPMDSGDLMLLARGANETLSEVNRVVFKLGGDSLDSITPTYTKRTQEVRRLKQDIDDICDELMAEFGVYRDIEQMPIILLGMGTGDKRSVVLRPVKTKTFLTADALLPDIHLPRAFYEKITARILAEIEGVSHVFLDTTNKPPATTEWE